MMAVLFCKTSADKPEERTIYRGYHEKLLIINNKLEMNTEYQLECWQTTNINWVFFIVY